MESVVWRGRGGDEVNKCYNFLLEGVEYNGMLLLREMGRYRLMMGVNPLREYQARVLEVLSGF